MSLTKSDTPRETEEQQSVLQKTSLESEAGLGQQLLRAGLAACLADLLTFPLDTAKVRLQVEGEGGRRGVGGTLLHIARREGLSALYSGLVPGLQRQMAFSAIRIGLYDTVKVRYMEVLGVRDTDMVEMLGVRVMAGVSTGVLAILLAQPTDVVKIRLQAGGRARYPGGVMEAYTTILAREGLLGLYRGMGPNIARNSIVNVGETVVYDAVKDSLLSSGRMSEGVPLHLTSALVAGVSATLVASPVDVIKTRYMSAPPHHYRGPLHCASATLSEGPAAFYKGFLASSLRLVSWNIVLWLTYEQIKLNTATADI